MKKKTNNIRWIPDRYCAICTTTRVTHPFKICSHDYATYKDEIDNNVNWVRVLVELSDTEHNYQRRNRGRLSPLFIIKE